MAREDLVISHTHIPYVDLEQILLFLEMLKISNFTFLKKNCERNCRIFWNILIVENGISSKLIINSTNM
jgi:hypothetical protein